MTDSFEAKKKILREQAEALLTQSISTVENLSMEEIKTLFHEYQVHQIELELQNEELRNTQKQFEITRDRFARLFNDAPVGYLSIDQNGIIAQANQTFSEMVEKEPHVLCGKALVDFIATADRSAFLGRFKAFFKNPVGKELSFALHGKGLLVRCVGRIENQGLEPGQRLLLVLSDISEQARAEEALQERERFLSSILETTQDGFWVIDAGGRLTDVNDAYCRMSGYTKEELEQMCIADLDAVEDDSVTTSRIARIVENGSEIFESMHRRKDGSFFDVEISASYLSLHGGMFVCFCRDISDRKTAEKASRESEMRYRLLSDLTMEGIIIHKNHIAVDMNISLIKLLGYDRQEIIGKNVLQMLVHDDDREIVRNNIVKEYAKPYIIRFVKKNGEVFFVEVEARNFELEGETLRVASVRDITERKKTEEEIRRINAELRKAIAEKDKFFSIIAHDGMSQAVEVAPDLVFAARVDAGQQQGHVRGRVALDNMKARTRLFAVQGLGNLDVGPVRNAAHDGQVLLFDLGLAEKLPELRCGLAVVGQKHDPPRFPVQAVNRVQLVSGPKFGLGQAGQGAVIRKAGSLGQDGGRLVPDRIVFGLGDKLRLGRDQSQKGRIVVDLQTFTGLDRRGRASKPRGRASGAGPPHTAFGHAVLDAALGQSGQTGQRIAGRGCFFHREGAGKCVGVHQYAFPVGR